MLNSVYCIINVSLYENIKIFVYNKTRWNTQDNKKATKQNLTDKTFSEFWGLWLGLGARILECL